MAVDEVLVIDADPNALDVLRQAISKQGFGIHECTTGAKALELLVTIHAQTKVVFVSHNIVDMSALDLVRQIKSDETMRSLPIVVLDDGANCHDMTEVLTNGASSYLVQPYNEGMASAVILSVLRERRTVETIARESQELVMATQHLTEGRFSFTTTFQARTIATFLAQTCPDPNRVVVGLSELMVNAVEHGNLGITYEEKSAFIQAGTLEEEIAARLKDPAYKDRVGTALFTADAEAITFRVEDDGAGFDWQTYLDIDMTRIRHAHGRGIAIAHQISFDHLSFEGKGNVAVATVKRSET